MGHLSPCTTKANTRRPRAQRREEPLRGGARRPRAQQREEPPRGGARVLGRRAAPLASTRESASSSEDPVEKKKKKGSHDEWKIKILKKDGVKSSVKVSHELKELIIVIVHYKVKFCLSWMFWYQSWLKNTALWCDAPGWLNVLAFRLPPLDVVSELMFLFSHVSLCPKRDGYPFLFTLCSGNFLCLLFDQKKKKKTTHYRNHSQVLVKETWQKCLARGPQSLAALCSRPKPSYPALTIVERQSENVFQQNDSKYLLEGDLKMWVS